MGLIVGANWGTSHLRAWLIETGGGAARILDEIEGPGVASLSPDEFEPRFFDAAGPWLDDHAVDAIWIAGMAGSTIGWRETGYLPCPAAVGGLRAGAATITARGRTLNILPGLSCRNRFGQPDVMRGEEVEIAGLLALDRRGGEHLVCLPGTHCKWVSVSGGAVTEFFTALSGELFGLLKAGSVLARGADDGAHEDAFLDGARRALSSQASLLHLLFSVRARQVTGDLAGARSAAFLSGLIIGCDVRDALAALEYERSRPVVEIIGAEALAGAYAQVLRLAGAETRVTPAREAGTAGFAALAALRS